VQIVDVHSAFHGRHTQLIGGTIAEALLDACSGQGRFSTDLDFTALEEHDHGTVILDVMGAVELLLPAPLSQK